MAGARAVLRDRGADDETYSGGRRPRARFSTARWNTHSGELRRIRGFVAHSRAVNPGCRSGPDGFLTDGATPGESRRIALFRGIERRGNRGGPEYFAAHDQARLGFGEGLATTRIKPYNPKAI